jgi:tryptophanyl-tRNA synthetase
LAYSDIKQELARLLVDTFARQRARHAALVKERAAIDEVLAQGAARARAMARPVLDRVRRAIGAK